MKQAPPLKLAVLANCQAPGIVAILEALLPEAAVHGWLVNDDAQLRQEITTQLATGYDIIFAHPRPDDEMFDPSWLRRYCDKVEIFPSIFFRGFHPDVTIWRRGEELISGPMDHQHSAIIAAAYTLGVAQERVPRLFNSLVYNKLGYLDVFPSAKAAFLKEHLDFGIDLSDHFEQWLESGPFMHTFNHPRIDVLSTVTTLAATRAGLLKEGTAPPSGLADELANDVRWPVLPELARRIGVSGDPLFYCAASLLEPGEQPQANLPELVRRFYRSYAALAEPTFDSPVREKLREILLPSQMRA